MDAAKDNAMNQQPASAPSQITCEQCRDLLSDYVDRELSEKEKLAVESHLGTCPRCGTESARLLGLKKIVQHWEGVPGSGEFRKVVVEKMIRESQMAPSAQFTEAARESARQPVLAPSHGAGGDEGDIKTLPPIWILLVAGALAFAAYYLVLFLRGI